MSARAWAIFWSVEMTICLIIFIYPVTIQMMETESIMVRLIDIGLVIWSLIKYVVYMPMIWKDTNKEVRLP